MVEKGEEYDGKTAKYAGVLLIVLLVAVAWWFIGG